MSSLKENQNKIPALEQKVAGLEEKMARLEAALTAEGKSASEILGLLSEDKHQLNLLLEEKLRREQQASAARADPTSEYQTVSIKINYGKCVEEFCARSPVAYADILCVANRKWPVLQEIKYTVQRNKIDLKGDEVFREDCNVKIVERCQGFSNFSEKEALEYAKVEPVNWSKNDRMFPEKDIPPEAIETVRLELLRRVAVFRRFNASETTMREFISVILIGAVLIVNDDLIDTEECVEMIAEHQITGILGRGPVDYDLIFNLFHICVAEAKKEKIEQGVFQNVAQMVACRDNYVYETKKRKRDEPNADYIQDLPSTGIVSTGENWMFLKYMFLEGEWKLYRSGEFTVPMTTETLSSKDICVPVLKSVMGRIVGMLIDQKTSISEFNKAKRTRT